MILTGQVAEEYDDYDDDFTDDFDEGMPDSELIKLLEEENAEAESIFKMIVLAFLISHQRLKTPYEECVKEILNDNAPENGYVKELFGKFLTDQKDIESAIWALKEMTPLKYQLAALKTAK